MLCKSAMSTWLSRMLVSKRWFLASRSILLSRSLSWPMIKKSAAAPQISTLNIGGAHRGWIIHKRGGPVAVPAPLRTKGAGGREADGWTIQQVHAHDPSEQKVAGQVSWPASRTSRTAPLDRSNQCWRPVRWACCWADSRIDDACFSSFRNRCP